MLQVLAMSLLLVLSGLVWSGLVWRVLQAA